jgi:hypothetical protein
MAAKNNGSPFRAPSLRAWLSRNWIVLVLPVGLFLLLRTYHTPALAHRRAKFTLGRITEQRTTQVGSRMIGFRFAVQRVAYSGTTGYPAATSGSTLGLRCLVEYDSLDPQQNVGHFNVTIPDSIREAPANGWRKLPFPVPQWILTTGQKGK